MRISRCSVPTVSPISRISLFSRLRIELPAAVLEASFDLLNGVPTAVLVFDIGWYRPVAIAQQAQNGTDRRVAFAPRHIGPLVALAILEVQPEDFVVLLTQ